MYTSIIDDFVRIDVSRSEAREHVNQILRPPEVQAPDETRAERYQRLSAQEADALPERID